MNTRLYAESNWICKFIAFLFIGTCAAVTSTVDYVFVDNSGVSIDHYVSTS